MHLACFLYIVKWSLLVEAGPKASVARATCSYFIPILLPLFQEMTFLTGERRTYLSFFFISFLLLDLSKLVGIPIVVNFTSCGHGFSHFYACLYFYQFLDRFSVT